MRELARGEKGRPGLSSINHNVASVTASKELAEEEIIILLKLLQASRFEKAPMTARQRGDFDVGKRMSRVGFLFDICESRPYCVYFVPVE